MLKIIHFLSEHFSNLNLFFSKEFEIFFLLGKDSIYS